MPGHLDQADMFDMGSYPAAVAGTGSVYGDLLTLPAAALEVIDRIEGHPDFYRRKLVTVTTETGSKDAWTYWAPEGFVQGRPRISSGDWFAREPIVNDPWIEVADAGSVSERHDPGDKDLERLVRRFADSQYSWLSSVRPNHRAHSVPIWHVWHRGRVY